MPELHGPWLEIAIFLPVIAMLFVGMIPSSSWRWRSSSLVSGLVFGITMVDWIDFLSLRTFEAHDPYSLSQSLFGREFIVVDEFNAPLLALSAWLYFAVILLTPSSKRERFPFCLTLVSMTLLLALMSTRAPVGVIVLLGALNLLPLIELRQRRQVWQMFAVYQGLALILIVLGWLLIDESQLASTQSVTGSILLALGLLIRCGCAPFHSWLIDLFDRASLGTSLLFVTPMVGAYGVVRLLLPIATPGVLQAITIASLITAIYAAGMILVQTCTRRFYGYLFLANSALLLVGLESLTAVGLTASLSLWLSLNVSLMSLGLVIRALEGRVGRLDLKRFHGLFRQMPLLAAFFLVAMLGSIGFPGTIGFVGFELLVECATHIKMSYGILVLAAMALNGIAAMRVYFRLFTGTTAPASISMEPRPVEQIVIWAMIVLMIGGGLYPQPGVSTRYHAATELLKRRGHYFDTDKNSLLAMPAVKEGTANQPVVPTQVQSLARQASTLGSGKSSERQALSDPTNSDNNTLEN
jgi:NADH-quinone oxidoreductase subunit M